MRNKKWIWIVVGLVILVMIILTLSYLGWQQSLRREVLSMSQSMWQKTPDIAVVPINRTVVPIAPANSSTISALGITMQFPWSGISTEATTTQALHIIFSNGKEILLIRETEADQIMASLSKLPGFTMSTAYDTYGAVLAETPSQVATSSLQGAAVFASELLDMKAVLLAGEPPDTNLYNFIEYPIRGYQFGDALSETSTVTIQFFDANDDQYGLVMSGTQGEIDFVLSSIRTNP